MPIAIACPSCGKRFDLPDSTAGKNARCKGCGQVFKIPMPTAARASAPPTLSRPVPASDPSIEELRNKPLAFDDDDDDDEEVYSAVMEEPVAASPLPSAAWPKAMPASSTAEKPIVKKKKKRASNPFENIGLPAAIFLGGNAVLWGFLLLVVWPSMQGREAAAPNIPDQALQNMPGIPPEMREAIARARPGENGFPQLPPAQSNEYPAGTNPAQGNRGNIRADIVAQQEQAINEMIGYLEQFAGIFDTINDQQSAQAAAPRVQDVANQAQPLGQRIQALPPPTPDEARELARRVDQRARAAITRLRTATARLASLPGVGVRAGQLTHGVNLMTSGLEQLLAGPPGGSRPYVELFVEGVNDGDESQVLSKKLGPLTDNPAAPGIASFYVGGGNKASYRVCPVANPQAFAQKLAPFGKTSVSGYKITLTGYKVDQAELAAFKKKQAADRGQQQQQANAGTPAKLAEPDPEAPAGADALTRSLFKLKSSNPGRQREGLDELSRVLRNDERRDEVVNAVLPLLESTDHFTASSAIKALGNWMNDKAAEGLVRVLHNSPDSGLQGDALQALEKSNSKIVIDGLTRYVRDGTDAGRVKDALYVLIRSGKPEVAPVLAEYVERSDDVFGRADAIKALGRMKAKEGAAAIAMRIRDNWGEAPDALRAIGPAAEPEVIKLLSDSDPQKRKAACEVLRDIGGTATFEAMLGLPPDSDTFVQDEARKAMEAVAQRIGSDEVKRIRAAVVRKKR